MTDSSFYVITPVNQINFSQLARKTGVAQPIIHRLASGQNKNPKLNTIYPIAEYFKVSLSQLIGEEQVDT